MGSLTLTETFIVYHVHTHQSIKAVYSDATQSACLMTTCFWELLERKIISIDEKKKVLLCTESELEEAYLLALVDTIKQEKSKTISGWIEFFCLGFSNKHLQKIVELVTHPLIQDGYVTTEEYEGVFGKKKTRYHTNFDALRPMHETFYNELFSNNALSSNTIILYTLLNRSGVASKYFSKDERKTLHRKFKQIKKSEAYKYANQYLDEIEAFFIIISTNTILFSGSGS